MITALLEKEFPVTGERATVNFLCARNHTDVHRRFRWESKDDEVAADRLSAYFCMYSPIAWALPLTTNCMVT